MKIKHAFSSTSSSTKLLEPDEKRIYHLGSLILGIIIFISFSFIFLKLHFNNFDLNYIWFIHKEITNGAHQIILNNYANTFGMENLNFFYPVIRMSLFYAAILGFISYKYTLTPIRDIKILNNGYFYNRYYDATHIYKIECKKRTGLGSKIKLAKVGDYTEELTKIEEDIYLSKREEEKGVPF